MSTASDVIAGLRRHYERTPCIWAPEIASPCGTRRADLIVVARRPARGLAPEMPGQVIGHEVKVSRADLLNELRKTEKWEAWRYFVDRWWLVVSDPALVTGLTVPPEWGILAPPTGRRTITWTVLQEAPSLPRQNTAAALMRVVKWQDNRLTEARIKAREDALSLGGLRQRVEALTEQLRQERERVPRLAAIIGDQV